MITYRAQPLNERVGLPAIRLRKQYVNCIVVHPQVVGQPQVAP